MADNEIWVTATQAARLCGRSVRRIFEWREKGLFPQAYKQYGIWNIAISDIYLLEDRYGFTVDAAYLATITTSPQPVIRSAPVIVTQASQVSYVPVVDTEAVDTLKKTIEALEQRIDTLTLLVTERPRPQLLSSSSDIDTPSDGERPVYEPLKRSRVQVEPDHVITTNEVMQFGRVELPIGSVRLINFAQMHRVNVSTIKSQEADGKITDTKIQTYAKDKRVEHWLTPDQQTEAILFWCNNNTRFIACDNCPHGADLEIFQEL